MAIYTRWGDPVKIVNWTPEKGEATVEYEDGERRIHYPGDLKADGGINEIHDALDALGVDES